MRRDRGGIKTVLIPEENVKDLAEIPDEIKNRLDIHPVRWIEQVLEHALERQPTPLSTRRDKTAASVPPTPAADDKSAGDQALTIARAATHGGCPLPAVFFACRRSCKIARTYVARVLTPGKRERYKARLLRASSATRFAFSRFATAVCCNRTQIPERRRS